MANPVFSGSENSMATWERLHLETGSQKFKMAAAKPKVPVSQRLYKIAKKFQRLTHVFGVRKLNSAIDEDQHRNWN
jgi:hypothetical protein